MDSLPTPRYLFNDERGRLSVHVKLNDSEFADLEKILGLGIFYATLARELAPPADTREHLAAMRKQFATARDALISCPPLVQAALYSAYLTTVVFPDAEPEQTVPFDWSMPRMYGLKLMYKYVADLDGLIAWFERAEKNIPRGKTGNRSETAQFITRSVDALLLRGKHDGLTRTEKKSDPSRNLLAACFALVGIEISPATAIRSLSKKRLGKVRAPKIV